MPSLDEIKSLNFAATTLILRELREIKSLLERDPIPRIEKVAIAPNDTLVVSCPGAISEEFAARIKSAVEEVFPGTKVVVFGDGIELKVVSSEPIPSPCLWCGAQYQGGAIMHAPDCSGIDSAIREESRDA